MKWVLSIICVCAGLFLAPAVALAHVEVTPDQVGIGAEHLFSAGVPNEKDQPVTTLKLLIPKGLTDVSPNVKPGWTVQVIKSGDAVTQITWTDGTIPAGQRDDFVFSAQMPAQATTLNWKAYQTYADGTVVAWDQKPTGSESETSTPYSQTKVVDDLTVDSTKQTTSSASNRLGIILGTVGIVMAASALSQVRASAKR